MTQYDEITDGYAKATYRPVKQWTYWYVLKSMLGDLRGKRVLDLACGEGISTRLCLSLGASLAIGVDISAELIKIAAQHEPPGSAVQYMVANVSMLRTDQWKPFSIVVAAMLLNYAENERWLSEFCGTAARALVDGGIFYGTVPNPDISTDYEAYGIKMHAESIADGSPVQVILSELDGTEYCPFTCYRWSRDSYEQALRESGFSVEWVPPTVHEEAMSSFPAGFWDDYLSHPTYNFFIARKQ